MSLRDNNARRENAGAIKGVMTPNQVELDTTESTVRQPDQPFSFTEGKTSMPNFRSTVVDPGVDWGKISGAAAKIGMQLINESLSADADRKDMRVKQISDATDKRIREATSTDEIESIQSEFEAQMSQEFGVEAPNMFDKDFDIRSLGSRARKRYSAAYAGFLGSTALADKNSEEIRRQGLTDSMNGLGAEVVDAGNAAEARAIYDAQNASMLEQAILDGDKRAQIAEALAQGGWKSIDPTSFGLTKNESERLRMAKEGMIAAADAVSVREKKTEIAIIGDKLGVAMADLANADTIEQAQQIIGTAADAALAGGFSKDVASAVKAQVAQGGWSSVDPSALGLSDSDADKLRTLKTNMVKMQNTAKGMSDQEWATDFKEELLKRMSAIDTAVTTDEIDDAQRAAYDELAIKVFGAEQAAELRAAGIDVFSADFDIDDIEEMTGISVGARTANRYNEAFGAYERARSAAAQRKASITGGSRKAADKVAKIADARDKHGKGLATTKTERDLLYDTSTATSLITGDFVVGFTSEVDGDDPDRQRANSLNESFRDYQRGLNIPENMIRDLFVDGEGNSLAYQNPSTGEMESYLMVDESGNKILRPNPRFSGEANLEADFVAHLRGNEENTNPSSGISPKLAADLARGVNSTEASQVYRAGLTWSTFSPEKRRKVAQEKGLSLNDMMRLDMAAQVMAQDGSSTDKRNEVANRVFLLSDEVLDGVRSTYDRVSSDLADGKMDEARTQQVMSEVFKGLTEAGYQIPDGLENDPVMLQGWVQNSQLQPIITRTLAYLASAQTNGTPMLISEAFTATMSELDNAGYSVRPTPFGMDLVYDPYGHLPPTVLGGGSDLIQDPSTGEAFESVAERDNYIITTDLGVDLDASHLVPEGVSQREHEEAFDAVFIDPPMDENGKSIVDESRLTEFVPAEAIELIKSISKKDEAWTPMEIAMIWRQNKSAGEILEAALRRARPGVEIGPWESWGYQFSTSRGRHANDLLANPNGGVGIEITSIPGMDLSSIANLGGAWQPSAQGSKLPALRYSNLGYEDRFIDPDTGEQTVTTVTGTDAAVARGNEMKVADTVFELIEDMIADGDITDEELETLRKNPNLYTPALKKAAETRINELNISIEALNAAAEDGSIIEGIRRIMPEFGRPTDSQRAYLQRQRDALIEYVVNADKGRDQADTAVRKFRRDKENYTENFDEELVRQEPKSMRDAEKEIVASLNYLQDESKQAYLRRNKVERRYLESRIQYLRSYIAEPSAGLQRYLNNLPDEFLFEVDRQNKDADKLRKESELFDPVYEKGSKPTLF